MRLAAGILADPRADDISIAWIFAKAEAMLAEEARRVEKEYKARLRPLGRRVRLRERVIITLMCAGI